MLSKKRVSDICSLHNCKEVEDFNKHIIEKINIPRDFAYIISMHAHKNDLTFNEGFRSWSYQYCKKNVQPFRYAVFAYDSSNAEGGMHDLLGYFSEIPETFDTEKECVDVYDMVKKEFV